MVDSSLFYVDGPRQLKTEHSESPCYSVYNVGLQLFHGMPIVQPV
jgi:hypothetical protein